LFGKIPQKDVREVFRLTPTAVERRALEPFLLPENDWRYLRRDHPKVYRTQNSTDESLLIKSQVFFEENFKNLI